MSINVELLRLKEGQSFDGHMKEGFDKARIVCSHDEER
jgi:hypothetical protein